MDKDDYEMMIDISRRRIREIPIDTKRFLIDRIDWRDRLIAVIGSRGTGKTTMILQHIKESFEENPDDALYVSLDHLWFETHSLYELLEKHYQNGGTHIFLDEVHHLPNWQKTIKNIYDDFPKINIVYTGSSLLRIDAESGDLSRRQLRYILPGLSFREYLYFEGAGTFEPIPLDALLKDHVRYAEKICENLPILKYFSDYLKRGYYPFYREVFSGYETRLSQISDQILESDYPAVENVNYSTIKKLRKMLYILAQSCPQTPNMSELYAQLETDRNQGLKMLYTLEKAQLLSLLTSEKASLKSMSKPDKIYCDNPNIMYALTEKINTGTLRETFFLNQLRSAGLDVNYPKVGDFLISSHYLFEVGGRKKSFDQIKDIPDSYLAIDDMEVGRGNKIPLWMFGFLY